MAVLLILVILTAAPKQMNSDSDGWYPAPPIPIRVDGEVSGFYAGSITDDPFQSGVRDWFTSLLLNYRHSPVAGRGDADLDAMDATARKVVAHYGLTAGVVTTPVVASGTSSGLAITLALLDAGTAGSLIPPGHQVVVSGVIRDDHRVLPVAGLNAKAQGAVKSGMTVFIIPRMDGQVVDPLPGLQVYRVTTVKQAIRRLCVLGADDYLCTYLRFGAGHGQ